MYHSQAVLPESVSAKKIKNKNQKSNKFRELFNIYNEIMKWCACYFGLIIAELDKWLFNQ